MGNNKTWHLFHCKITNNSFVSFNFEPVYYCSLLSGIRNKPTLCVCVCDHECTNIVIKQWKPEAIHMRTFTSENTQNLYIGVIEYILCHAADTVLNILTEYILNTNNVLEISTCLQMRMT